MTSSTAILELVGNVTGPRTMESMPEPSRTTLVEVRQLDDSWVVPCAALAAEVLQDTWDDPPTLLGALERYGSIHAWRSYFQRMVFGAFWGDELVGVATLHEQPTGCGYFGMHNVKYRHQGIGSALTEARLVAARAAGYQNVRAHVTFGNDASIGNLVKHGFVYVGCDTDDETMLLFEQTLITPQA